MDRFSSPMSFIAYGEMINLDFSIKKAKKPDEAWLSRVDDWLEVTETLMLGDVVFVVDGRDFGVRNNYILAVADALLTAADALVFYEDRIQIGYPEKPPNLQFQRLGNFVNISTVSRDQMEKTVNVDLFALCREIGGFAQRVVWQLFEEYPTLMNNQNMFSSGCRHGGLHSYYYHLMKNPSLSSSL